jgi:hypothetical protein
MILPASKLAPVAGLDAYVMDPMPYNWGPMLAPFSPPLPREGQVVLASFFGDVFVEDKNGAVWWLNGMEERVDRIAISNKQFLERVSREHLTMLKTKLMESLIVGDELAKAGTIYGLKTPRSEGGKYHPDNIGAAPIADAFAYMGELFRKKNAPPPDPAKGPKAAPEKQKSGFWGKKK